MRFFPAALALVALGCSEATTPSLTVVVPAEVRWLEWPFQVSSVVGESLRVVVYVPCGYPRIDVSTADETIEVKARDESKDDGTCLGVNTGIYDSILALPALNPREPPELFRAVPYRVIAYMHNAPSPTLVPVLLGQLELTFRPPFQPIRMVGGLARLDRDSADCSWATPLGLLAEPYLLLNPPQLDSAGYPYEAILAGPIVSLDSLRCGQASAISLQFADVFLQP
jgi:hypothetical protein